MKLYILTLQSLRIRVSCLSLEIHEIQWSSLRDNERNPEKLLHGLVFFWSATSLWCVSFPYLTSACSALDVMGTAGDKLRQVSAGLLPPSHVEAWDTKGVWEFNGVREHNWAEAWISSVCVCLSLSTLTFCCSAFTHEPSLQNPTMMSSFPFNFFLCESLKLLKAGFISVVMQGERILSGAGEKSRDEHKNYRTQDSDALVFSLKT